MCLEDAERFMTGGKGRGRGLESVGMGLETWENKKQKLYCTVCTSTRLSMVNAKWFGFWELVKLRGWDHASSFTSFSVFFSGSDLGEQLW